MPDTPSPQFPPQRAPALSPDQAARGTAVREQLRQRVGRYKRRVAVAAIVGFGVISFLIANPDLGVAAPSSSTSQQDPANFFNQQGGNTNGNGTSQQPPSTSSHTS